MSRWDSNGRPPFTRGQDDAILYNDNSPSVRYFYGNSSLSGGNNAGAIAQSYNIPISHSFVQQSENWRPTRLNNNSSHDSDRKKAMSEAIDLSGSSETNNRAQSTSTVMHSNLTPLAKEFTPSSSSTVKNTFFDEPNKKYGAIKKNRQWSRESRDNKPSRYYNTRQNNEGDENRLFFRQNTDNFTNSSSSSSNQRYFKNSFRNTFQDFNKSKEQSKVLQETRKFLEQVKSVEVEQKEASKSGENVESTDGNYYRKGNTNKNKGYFNYASRGSHKHKKNHFYENLGYDKKYEDKFSHGGERKEGENDYQEKKYETEKKKTYFDQYERRRSGFQTFKKKLDAGSQRERLEQLVLCRQLECLVCCEKLRHSDQVWSCTQCFHILHLQCIKRWAQSSKLDAGWRCPACQNVYQDIPNAYRCYCAKQLNPAQEPGAIPHSCGDVCGRKGRSCAHACTLICHPGPCPDCTVIVPRSCGCGATKPTVKCSSTVPVTCQGTCGKFLKCATHKCVKKCHEGDCGDCEEFLRQECYCGNVGRKIKCSAEQQGVTKYECGEICGKLLSCGNHNCERNCHEGPCDVCALAPGQITTCCCGQTKLTQPRKSCLEPVPCCEKVCGKKLLCGQPSAPHLCTGKCHEGPCSPCSRTTIMRCRCGHMDKELLCLQVTTKADDARCEKKCTKKRLCGKHKCNQLCCIELDHICPLPCNRLLPCGQHRCEQPCHRGRCPPCWRTSFEELYCECGSSVLYPPVACGTRPPPCDQLCSRPRPCGHDVLHTCHTGPCPPCTVLTKRWCHGHHEQRSTIPCHQDNFSCGLVCGREMACGKHKCIQSCHDGRCRAPCTQPCGELRPVCGHPCNQPCHDPPCPETACKSMVKVTCQCGLRKNSRVCMELAGEYQNIAMAQLASKMEEMQLGYSVDITDIVSGQKKGNLKTLECNDDCRLLERNRRLAIGLQIRNPDLSSKLTPRYSDYMRGWAKKDAKFCQYVHDKLSELVQLAKQSKQKNRSYSFETMNRDKRHFVHEYCEHFGCDSAAYDPEPNRNVVATAFKDKSWLPSYSLLQVIQRENGLRKVPGPQQLGKIAAGMAETVTLKLPGRIPRPTTPPGEFVDYFNNPPE